MRIGSGRLIAARRGLIAHSKSALASFRRFVYDPGRAHGGRTTSSGGIRAIAYELRLAGRAAARSPSLTTLALPLAVLRTRVLRLDSPQSRRAYATEVASISGALAVVVQRAGVLSASQARTASNANASLKRK